MTNEELMLKIQQMQLDIKKLKHEVYTLNGGKAERGSDSQLNIDHKIKDKIKEVVNIDFVNSLYRNK